MGAKPCNVRSGTATCELCRSASCSEALAGGLVSCGTYEASRCPLGPWSGKLT